MGSSVFKMSTRPGGRRQGVTNGREPDQRQLPREGNLGVFSCSRWVKAEGTLRAEAGRDQQYCPTHGTLRTFILRLESHVRGGENHEMRPEENRRPSHGRHCAQMGILEKPRWKTIQKSQVCRKGKH